MKSDITDMLEDESKHSTLIDMIDDGFEHVENEGDYLIMVDEQGIIRYYDPKTDTILPYIERREEYHE